MSFQEQSEAELAMSGFEQLCGHLGLDPAGDALGNINELMNFSLQCLGGIRYLFNKLEAQRKSKMLKSLGNIGPLQELGVHYCTIRQVFEYAVKRTLNVIVAADEQISIDPSRHIVESFPNGGTIGKRNWLSVHWAILGDPQLHPYDRSHFCGANNTAASPLPAAEDDQLVILDSLAKILPEAFAETDRDGRSILHIAARLDSIPLFEKILDISSKHNGPKITDANNNGALPLHNTTRFSGSIELLQRVEQEYPHAVTIPNHDGLLPLHWAAVKNTNVAIINHLLAAYPAGIRLPNAEGYLPMHCAGQNDCLEVVRTIYNAYPEAVEIADSEGGLPLHHACCFTKNVEVVKLIYHAFPTAISIPQHDGVTPIHLAASQNDSVKSVQFLLQVCPEAASMADNEGWLALRCIGEALRSRDNNNKLTSRRMQCFRMLLQANPAAVKQISLVEHDFISRLCLNTLPTLNLPLYRELNYQARKHALCLMVQLAQLPFVELTLSSNGKQSRRVLLQRQQQQQMRSRANTFSFTSSFTTKVNSSSMKRDLFAQLAAAAVEKVEASGVMKTDSLMSMTVVGAEGMLPSRLEQDHADEKEEEEREERNDINRAMTLQRLCQYYLSFDGGKEVPAGVLRKILKFI